MEGGLQTWMRLRQTLCELYKNHYSSSSPSSNEIFCVVQSRTAPVMADSFLKPITKDEVKNASFSLGALVTLSLTKYLASFITIVGISWEMISLMQCLFHWKWSHAEGIFNHAVLIPKVTHWEFIDQFRLIGLRNFHYKVIARIITKCMKNILSKVVDDSQSAFITGWHIIGYVVIVIAYELMQFLKSKKKWKKVFMAMN